MFASKFKKFLNRKPNTVPPTESEDDEYIWYIKDHLEEKCPLFCAQLWYVMYLIYFNGNFVSLYKGNFVQLTIYVICTNLLMKDFCYTR